ncbi:PIG-L deacetylase family protein [Roseomonas elaeocarpi]|uniref:PIG-L deacetylase family protein n=1 Tax=Roseomonas elaeocarpi TaxID=907779 RepID=A0ABV6JQ47_9PROT
MKAADFLREAEHLPIAGLDGVLPGGGTVLVVAPHPDDESLGCGGLLALLTDAGRPGRVLIVSDGAASHPNSRTHPPARVAAIRREEATAALGALGMGPDRLVMLGLPDGAVPHDGPGFDAAVTAMANLLRRDGAEAVAVSWEHDPHPDHLASWRMARAAAREAGVRLLAYPIWGWRHLYTEIGPLPPLDLDGPPRGWRLDIAAVLPRKQAAVAAHVSQTTRLISDDPHGFMLSPEVLALFERPWEVLLEIAA